MNIVSNFIFHYNNCIANRVLVKFHESANEHGATPRSDSLDAEFTFKGLSLTNHFRMDS